MDEATTTSDVRVSNFAMAAGRIGVAILLVPPLWGISFLVLFSQAVKSELFTVVLGVCLFLVGILLIWTALSVPLWVAVSGEQLRVGYLLWRFTAEVDDIDHIKMGQMISTIGPGTRRYPLIKIYLKNGRKIAFSSTVDLAAVLRSTARKASNSDMENFPKPV